MTATNHKTLQARRGFSLVELIVVIVIIASLGAIAAPRFASADVSYRTSGAAHQLADAIRDAATQARNRSTSVRIRISASSDNFSAAVQSPLEYIALFNTTDRPFNIEIIEVKFADSSSFLTVNGFGVYSTSVNIKVGVGKAIQTVMVDADAGTVTVGSVADSNTFWTDVTTR